MTALREIFIDLLRLPDTNRYLAGLISDLSLSYPLPGDHPLTGQRMLDVDLVTEAGPAQFSTLLRSGHAVLLDLAGTIPADLRLPPRVDLVRATSTEDVGAGAVLVRPDSYVCWATDADAPADSPDTHDDSLFAAIADGLTKTAG